jgi:hypothetical protein
LAGRKAAVASASLQRQQAKFLRRLPVQRKQVNRIQRRPIGGCRAPKDELARRTREKNSTGQGKNDGG